MQSQRNLTALFFLLAFLQWAPAASFAPPQRSISIAQGETTLYMIPTMLGMGLSTRSSGVRHSPREKTSRNEWDLEREVLRLDSLGGYVLVTILCATSSRAALEDQLPEAADALIQNLHTLLMLVSTLSVFSGIYSTIMFSLCILYGKTALGMQRDRVYDYLLEKTHDQRVRGFQAFLLSMLFFVSENALLAMEKVPAEINPLIAVSSVGFLGFTGKEVLHIISHASLNYRPEKSKEKKEEGLEYSSIGKTPMEVTISVDGKDLEGEILSIGSPRHGRTNDKMEPADRHPCLRSTAFESIRRSQMSQATSVDYLSSTLT